MARSIGNNRLDVKWRVDTTSRLGAGFAISLPIFLPAFLLAFLTALLLNVGPVHAFSPELLHSVVSILPQGVSRQEPPSSSKGRLEEPEGTGFAVFPEGYVITNAHVLDQGETILVRYADGRIAPAEIVGTDPLTDIALIRAHANPPVPAWGPIPPLASPVCAIGNQFGLGLSVTCGVVSATRRSGTGFNPIEDFIQTDAAINPGGSGGPLVDENGRVVGMVSAIFTKRSDANIGVNFAASMDLVLRVARDLRDYGVVKRGKSGLRVRPLTEDQRVFMTGAVVSRVTGAAVEAGLEVGDVITAVDGRIIRMTSDVSAAIYLRQIGDTVSITAKRGKRQLTANLVLRP